MAVQSRGVLNGTMPFLNPLHVYVGQTLLLPADQTPQLSEFPRMKHFWGVFRMNLYGLPLQPIPAYWVSVERPTSNLFSDSTCICTDNLQ